MNNNYFQAKLNVASAGNNVCNNRAVIVAGNTIALINDAFVRTKAMQIGCRTAFCKSKNGKFSKMTADELLCEVLKHLINNTMSNALCIVVDL